MSSSLDDKINALKKDITRDEEKACQEGNPSSLLERRERRERDREHGRRQEEATGERQIKRSKLQTEELVLARRDLLEQTALDVKGACIMVKQKIAAGLSVDESLLYVRRETVELWNALNGTSNSKNLNVVGPPGSGKSTEVWAWALWKARNDELKVTWYHLSKLAVVKALIDGTENKITTYNAEIDDIENSEGSIVIVDGVTETNLEALSNCTAWYNIDKDHRCFIFVSIFSLTIAMQEKMEVGVVDLMIGSWTIEQYQEACKNKEFFTQVKNYLECPGIDADANMDALLLSKYYFAGGCARWMFEFSFKTFMKDVNKYLDKISDYKSLWSSGYDAQTQLAVDHLRGVTINVNGVFEMRSYEYFFISQYVVAVLADKCDNEKKFLFNGYRNAAATMISAFKDWIFKFDVDYQLSQACSKKSKFHTKMRSHIESTLLVHEDWSVDEYVEFGSTDDLINRIQSLDANRVLWAKPKSWCWKAYDFLCLWKDDSKDLKMVVANATVAKTHSVLLNEVNKLASSMGERNCVISEIRFVFIVPNKAEYSIGSIEGQLRQWNNLRGKKWPNSDSSKFDDDCLAVIEVETTSQQ